MSRATRASATGETDRPLRSASRIARSTQFCSSPPTPRRHSRPRRRPYIRSPVNAAANLAPHARNGTVNGAARPCSPPRGDRKSTRLNSSHVRISYAVFCLKKKKKKKKTKNKHKKKKTNNNN